MPAGALYSLALLLPAIFKKTQPIQSQKPQEFLKAEPWTPSSHHRNPFDMLRRGLITKSTTFHWLPKMFPWQPYSFKLENQATLLWCKVRRFLNTLGFCASSIFFLIRPWFLLNWIHVATPLLSHLTSMVSYLSLQTVTTCLLGQKLLSILTRHFKNLIARFLQGLFQWYH